MSEFRHSTESSALAESQRIQWQKRTGESEEEKRTNCTGNKMRANFNIGTKISTKTAGMEGSSTEGLLIFSWLDLRRFRVNFQDDINWEQQIVSIRLPITAR